jgi:hypothetical protein
VPDEEEVENIEKIKQTNTNFPIRLYSNVHLLGVERESTQIDNKPIHIWKKPKPVVIDGIPSFFDAGIFMSNDVSKGSDKNDIVKKLLQLKSAILFDSWNLLPMSLQQKFNPNDIEYYVHVQEDDHLIGGTNLSQDKLKVNGKVVSIVAKLTSPKGKKGKKAKKAYYLTLGTLANPDTWERNKDKIIKALDKRLQEEPDNKELEYYRNNISGIILEYRNTLSELTKKQGLVRRINTPDFTAMSDLVTIDSDGNELSNMKLESMNSEYSPWDAANPYAVVSDVHLLMRDDLGLKLKRGTSVRYVTSNVLLKASDLKQIYES